MDKTLLALVGGVFIFVMLAARSVSADDDDLESTVAEWGADDSWTTGSGSYDVPEITETTAVPSSGYSGSAPSTLSTPETSYFPEGGSTPTYPDSWSTSSYQPSYDASGSTTYVPSSTYSAPTYVAPSVPAGPSAEEIERQRLNKQASYAANERGVGLYNKGDEYHKRGDWAGTITLFENAVDAFEEALRYMPDDSVSQQNLKNAQEYLQSAKDRQQAQWDEEEHKRKDAETSAKIQEGIARLRESLRLEAPSAPSKVDFMQSFSDTSTVIAPGAEKATGPPVTLFEKGVQGSPPVDLREATSRTVNLGELMLPRKGTGYKTAEEVKQEIKALKAQGLLRAPETALWKREPTYLELEKDPAFSQAVDEAARRFLEEQERAEQKAHAEALQEMSQEMERLKKEGLFNEGDDLLQKEYEDPKFRQAVNEARDRVVKQLEEKEGKARLQSFEKMSEEVKRLKEKWKAKGNE